VDDGDDGVLHAAICAALLAVVVWLAPGRGAELGGVALHAATRLATERAAKSKSAAHLLDRLAASSSG
jgi:hypothetical protein